MAEDLPVFEVIGDDQVAVHVLGRHGGETSIKKALTSGMDPVIGSPTWRNLLSVLDKVWTVGQNLAAAPLR